MTNISLARSYLTKARVRLTILPVLFDAAAYSDVVREAQEIVELALKGMLRQAGVEPPHWHDVGGLVKDTANDLPVSWQRRSTVPLPFRHGFAKEREFAFYGDIDFLPTEQYDAGAAQRAIDDARFVVTVADRVIR